MDYSQPDKAYKALIEECMLKGDAITTRNSNVLRIVGKCIEFKTTPLFTLRRTSWKNACREWEWFMSGSDNIKDLHPNVRKWWSAWADKEGRVKYNYSQQFRHQYGCDRDYGTCNDYGSQELVHCDQIEEFIRDIKEHPNSRRILLTTWNSAEMRMVDCPITNCHSSIIQAFVTNNRLKLVTYQRSCDLICGFPHNALQMSAFHLWLCAKTNKVVDSLVYMLGDVHIYEQHFPLAAKMMIQIEQESPQLVYTPISEDFKADNFTLDREYIPSLLDSAVMVV